MHKKKKIESLNKTEKLLLFVIFFVVLMQGGFYSGTIILTAIVLSAVCIFKKPQFKKTDILVLVFWLWYFVCSIKKGFYLEYVSRAIMIYDVFIFCKIYIDFSDNHALFKTTFLKYSTFIAAISVIGCVISSAESMSLQRSLFPFGYSNMCGIYFGILFLLSDKETDVILKKSKYLYAIALLLTQSVGAIGLTVLAVIILDIKNKRNFVILGMVLIFIILMHERLEESAFTFIERFLQIRDGMVCIVNNPLMGIGVGIWEHQKGIWQSGFYTANIIHCGPVQIGTDSGVIGMILFVAICLIACIKLWKKNKYTLVCFLVLLTHICFDVDLYYLTTGILSVIVLNFDKESEVCQSNFEIYHRMFFVIMLVFALFLGMVNIQEKNLNFYEKSNEFNKIINSFEKFTLSKLSISSNEIYATSLMMKAEEEKLTEFIEKQKLQTNQYHIITSCLGRDLCEEIEKQPYNIYLYREIENSGTELQKNKASQIKEKGIAEMSYFGKILYINKGVNLK